MRFPPLSRYVHIGLLFLSHFCLGTFVAVWGTYQYEQSRWFRSLGQEQGRQLLSLRESLLASRTPVRGTPDALERDVSRLEKIRRTAPADAEPILGLRLAADHALLAQLYRSASSPAAAGHDSAGHDSAAHDSSGQCEAARSLLRELGWQDSSERTLDELAARRLQTIGRKDVR